MRFIIQDAGIATTLVLLTFFIARLASSHNQSCENQFVLSRFLYTHTFSELRFTNQIAIGGDNVDTVYFNLESRDLVGRVDGDRKRR